MTEKQQHLDLATFRARMGEGSAPEYWRTLDELVQDPSFEEVLQREFPREAAAFDGGVDRRDFVKLMSASLAMSGLAACAPPQNSTIVPYVNSPEQIVPGKPLFYATAMESRGVATGLLIESHMGRPTKAEGNPDHPGSLGATDLWAQASLLSLYDPDRSQTVRQLGEVSTWQAFVAALQGVLAPMKASGGAGLRILTESSTSPTLALQMQQLRQRFPNAVWHTWEPDTRDNVREGARLAFGRPVHTVYRFSEADVVLSLGADFTHGMPGSVRYAREFMDRRRVRAAKKQMNRLYVAETMPSPTGTMADHRLPATPTQIEALARSIAGQLGVAAGSMGSVDDRWAMAVAKDLRAHAGRCLVIAGEGQPPLVQALAHAMNAALGNVGRTVVYTEPLEINPVNQTASIRDLVSAMSAGQVRALVVAGGDPAFNAPADLPFAAAMEKVPFRAHLANFYNDTSARSHWHVPMSHFLEQWSDARAWDGTVSIVQPLIQPLYNGHSVHELVAAMLEDITEPHELVRNTWRRAATGEFESFWTKALHDGVVPATALPALALSASGAVPSPAGPAGGSFEIFIAPDPTVHDGRWANNAWLQELPKPVTKITWDNVGHVSLATAAARGWADGDLVRIAANGREVVVPVWTVPGHADDAMTLHYGYGGERAGRVAKGAGTNVFPLRTTAGDLLRGATVEKTGEKTRIATVQAHHHLSTKFEEGGGAHRDIIRSGTLAQFAANEHFADKEGHEVHGGPTLYPAWEYNGNKWSMVIDTNVCTGCGVCTLACQAENSIPVVGKAQVLVGREMHWIRTDHYFKGQPDDAKSLEMYNAPIPCMHCENAPCEPVCPVEATTHSDEGLNDMTYNRCVGTRYCANNCPYKVRRFNFLEWNDYETESYKLMRNPDVTVRSRGVMEKCTYCTQRISAARIDAEREGRPIRDGEVRPACAQACPAQAIAFGNLNDKTSEVAKLVKEPLHYGMLTELNTQPRTRYLGALRNPNPELAPAAPAAPAEHAE